MSKTDWSGIRRESEKKAHASEVAALRQQLDHAVAQIERLENSKRAKIIAATPIRKRDSGDIVRVIIPDTHGAKSSRQAIAAMLSDIKALNPQEIILLGDHVDCGGHLAQHHVMGYVAETTYSYEDDLAEANAFLDSLRTVAPDAKIEYIEGNHECLTPDHDVLTRVGWIPISAVTRDHEVATLGWGGITQWQKPTALIRRQYDGEIISTDSPFWNSRMTPGHRVCHYGTYIGDVRYVLAGDAANHKSSAYNIPSSALGRGQELPEITDDEIRLVGWILTDGCLTGGIRIYQSKDDGIEEIGRILKSIGISHSFTVRKKREVSPIGGVAVKTSRPQGVFYINSESRDRVLALMGVEGWHHSNTTKKKIPGWVDLLSQRQFHVLLSAIIGGDGHATSDRAASIYGSKEFLEQIQALCVTNGVRAILRSKSRKGMHSHWVLYTKRTHASKLGSGLMKQENYSGTVHCLSMPNQNFFVRRNGVVHVTGNCRVENWCVTQTLRHAKDSEGLRKLYAPQYRLFLEQRGIPYYRRSEYYDNLPIPGVIKRGKCYFFHGISTAKNATAKTVEQLAGNCVFGHTHRAESTVVRKLGSGVIGSWNPGCLCDLQPLWQHTNPTAWTHGYGIQLVHDTDFLHLNIPIIENKSLFGALVRL